MGGSYAANVPSLNDVAHRHTDLSDADLDRMHLLLADWQLLADLAFSDLVLWLPTWNGSGYVVAAQMRPTTGSTVFGDDLVGTFLPRGRRPLLDQALEQGRVVRSRNDHALAPAEAVPVKGADERVVGVIARHADPALSRIPGRLETAYLEIADRLSRMLADGTFPSPGGLEGLESSPRAGDGLLRLDVDGVVVYASPNALSAYRRLGLAADLVGAPLEAVTRQLVPRRGPVDEELATVAAGRAARGIEVEGKGTTVQLRSIPLMVGADRIGAVILIRDVTELRRRERELLTKDATIREIHHRVKNNLQTVASLLRLQARRIASPEGREALEEAVRRVGSIALVHELLSTTPEEAIAFDDVARRVLLMVAEVAAGGAQPAVRPVLKGTFGVVPAEIATSLAVVLSELVQNAVQHGFATVAVPSGAGAASGERSYSVDEAVAAGSGATPQNGRGAVAGTVEVWASRAGDTLTVEVIDDGVGLPEGFDLAASDQLGLQIVRTLVEREMGGELTLEGRPTHGTRAVIQMQI
jgi:two-component system, sensor histidine kinase PdtaS